jgi:hypothetical protein
LKNFKYSISSDEIPINVAVVENIIAIAFIPHIGRSYVVS